MESFYGILAGSILVLISTALVLAGKKLARSLSERAEENPEQDRMEEISDFIDQSLRGYPDRTRYTNAYGQHVWTCHSKLFTFRITLQKLKLRYGFEITFFCKTPFHFRIRRTVTGNFMKVRESSGKQTAKLLDQKEISALLQRLLFYDSVTVSQTGITGQKTISGVAGLVDWPKTIGASITFVRFLLNFEDRKESTTPGEALCPYCRGVILAQEKSVSCQECRTTHHQVCWNETDRCSVFGCGSKSELELK
jgi:hypothetical protein